MRKIYLAILVIMITPMTQAQNGLGINAGWNMTTARASFNALNQPTGYVQGFGIGLMYNVEFEGVLHFAPYLAFNRRGYTITPNIGTIKKYENHINYIDLAPLLSLQLPMGESNFFFIKAGPVVGIAISGTEITTNNNNVMSSQKMKISTDGNYGLGDIGLHGGIGLLLKKISIEASYYLGMASINNDEEQDGRNIKNRMISLGIGYYFK